MDDSLGFGIEFELRDQFSRQAAQAERMMAMLDERLEDISEQLGYMSVQSTKGEKGLERVGRQARETTLDLHRLGQGVDRLGTGLLRVGGILTGGFALAMGKGFSLLIEEEKTLAGLTTMLGDQAKAYEHLAGARAYAVRTPWAEREITEADPLLMAAGFTNIEHVRDIASDAASMFGRTYSEGVQAIISGQFGEFEPLKRLGMKFLASDFEEGGRFAGMSFIDAVEGELLKREGEIGEATARMADTMTARLSNIQARFEEVLREGSRVAFEALADELDSLLAWFDQAAESGELANLAEGVADAFGIILSVAKDLLGVLTAVIDTVGAENIAKIVAYAAQWSLFGGIAFKAVGAVLKLTGALSGLGAASAVALWPLAAVAGLIGGIILLVNALEPEPIAELAENLAAMREETNTLRDELAGLQEDLADQEKALADVNAKIQEAIDAGEPIQQAWLDERREIEKNTAALKENIATRAADLALKQQEDVVAAIMAGRRVAVEMSSMGATGAMSAAVGARDIEAVLGAVGGLVNQGNLQEGRADISTGRLMMAVEQARMDDWRDLELITGGLSEADKAAFREAGEIQSQLDLIARDAGLATGPGGPSHGAFSFSMPAGGTAGAGVQRTLGAGSAGGGGAGGGGGGGGGVGGLSGVGGGNTFIDVRMPVYIQGDVSDALIPVIKTELKKGLHEVFEEAGLE